MTTKKRYEVSWAKTYYATGTEVVEAYNETEAENIVLDNIGDYTGSMQYDPNEDYSEVLSEFEIKENK
jgi:hypothetical protein